MLREQLTKRTKKRRIRFPRIVADAKTLGVSRIHLYYVLSQQRVSPRLLRRYHELKKRAA